MSLKMRFIVYNVIMALGAICAAADILYDLATGVQNKNLPIMIALAAVCFVVGVTLRFTFVKCPHCGDKLIGHKRVPVKCPVCGTMADKKAQ